MTDAKELLDATDLSDAISPIAPGSLVMLIPSCGEAALTDVEKIVIEAGKWVVAKMFATVIILNAPESLPTAVCHCCVFAAFETSREHR